MLTLNALLNRECSNCGSKDAAWHCHEVVTNGVVDGKIKLSEVSSQFYLGCNECSETLAALSGNELAAVLSNSIAKR